MHGEMVKWWNGDGESTILFAKQQWQHTERIMVCECAVHGRL